MGPAKPDKTAEESEIEREGTKPSIDHFALIIGGMLCGSPQLFSALGQHPELATCKKTEPHFFSSDENWAEGPDAYYSLWDFDPSKHKYALEATTHYSKDVAHPGVPERMAELGAEYKVIYVLRHPIDRAEAHVGSTLKGGNVSPEEYRKALPYAARLSSYATQLDAYRKVFPEMAFLLIDAEQLESDPKAVLDQCVDFLGLEPSFEFALPELSPSANASPQSTSDDKKKSFALLPEDRQKIAEIVLEDLERLHDQYGFDSSIWYDRDFRKAAWKYDEKPRLIKRLETEALEAAQGALPDIFVFPVIDWHFRIQRPQHLAMALADAGHRVFYFMTTFSPWPGHPGYELIESPYKNVFICKLHCRSPHPRIYNCREDMEMALDLARGLDTLRGRLLSDTSVELVQHPFWRQVVTHSQGARLIYDCMDNHSGFSTSGASLIKEEEKLFSDADILITTSVELSRLVATHRSNTVIRNAAEVEHFAQPPDRLAFKRNRPRVGYFGAISSWFDVSLVAQSAKALPDWEFILVGDTFEVDTRELSELDNVRFEGEVPYERLPEYLHSFDVCMIPFQINDLIRCTNPVKVYEYLSAGKPVVATPMPEIELLGDLVRVGRNTDDFIEQLRKAMIESTDASLATRRAQWAAGQTWKMRGDALRSLMENSVPRVSVVVLCFNNLEMTKACLNSLERFSHYPNLEIIVVDNASSDGTAEFLEELLSRQEELPFAELKVISNERNLGFAGGNNVGIWQAAGDYVVLLNNDTFVTRGWVLDLIRHFRLAPDLGLIGPVTNMIGNEAKVPMDYTSMEEMAVQARDYTIRRDRRRLSTSTLGFFCVAISRRVLDEVGLLDEEFEVGFFEDDDYCRRAELAGFEIAIAEDVFIHHHLSASFNALGQERRDEIFAANKKVYEKKWGHWEPHQKRSEFSGS